MAVTGQVIMSQGKNVYCWHERSLNGKILSEIMRKLISTIIYLKCGKYYVMQMGRWGARI